MKLFSLGNTEIRLHWLLIATWAVLMFTPYQAQFFMIFGIIFIHEMAHAFVARYYGFRILQIELHPFGGVARISEGIAEKPHIESRIAIAGPAMNIVLVVICYGGTLLWQHMGGAHTPDMLTWFIQANLIIGIGNLLPALPLDGGRIVRAYLAERRGLMQATQRTIVVSKGIAFLLFAAGGLGLFFAWPTVTGFGIAGIIWFSLKDEQRSTSYVVMQNLIQRQTAPPAETYFAVEHIVVFSHSRLYDVAMSYVPNRYYFMWHVTAGGEVKRLITEQHVLETLFTIGPTARVRDVIEDSEALKNGGDPCSSCA